MTAGIQAGASVLIVVATLVIAIIARFAFRLWAAESAEGADKTEVKRA